MPTPVFRECFGTAATTFRPPTDCSSPLPQSARYAPRDTTAHPHRRAPAPDRASFPGGSELQSRELRGRRLLPLASFRQIPSPPAPAPFHASHCLLLSPLGGPERTMIRSASAAPPD